ncbi:acetyltransferase [Paenibacillus darwinianus]|uniref:Acetyltransferase n=1 Tax=Paenibacillus darwinianus TaxID=1380763 RepID=A0A9W5W6V8_9BACL|nr:MBOAT family protein [Paenibacillus darwinianus]EXX85882.1 acetyltransferase [Paenibacillus darwinianus]EXX86112.1 acetyltransferase [Paenibacillus darwinianus]EXX86213.1 acetyltransferase [Paenibacillus darwinianus]
MLFNSYVFIFAFLPVTVTGYFLLNRFRLVFAAKVWLAVASLVFYGWWDYRYVPLILASIAFNYTVGRLLMSSSEPGAKLERHRKAILTAGIAGNVLLLGYYKYADFFLENVNALTGSAVPLLKLVLPLGISFFTFTQIAFLVDAYRKKVKEQSIVNYVLFVTFFPHLIAGPILHHSEMMPQFDRLRNTRWNWTNVAVGAYVFCIGLFKKMVIADTFAEYANSGFATAQYFIESWVASLSYTFQLYFDFSGYTDMAIGIALLFNIRLPQNFNSPYKAVSIQDFWRRWHMTLSRFLRDYIYIPLGGNRRGEFIMLRNSMLTFLIGGFWHGAGWTFIIWGFLHGAAQIAHRLWTRQKRPMPTWLAWFVTFMFINFSWVFFRAESWSEAIRILKGMAGLNGVALGEAKTLLFPIVLIAVAVPVVLFMRNSSEREREFRPNWRVAVTMAAMFVLSLLFFNRITEFLYFNF